LIRRTCFILLALGFATAFSTSAAAQAEEPIEPSGSRPATPAELGFTGSPAEIRRQAEAIAEKGSWGRPSPTDIKTIKEMAAGTPEPLADPFDLALLAQRIKEAGEIGDSDLLRSHPARSISALDSEPQGTASGWSSGDLPGLEIAPNCRNSGQRIRLYYVYRHGYQPTEAWEGLQPWSSIARANTKFLFESALSSENERVVTLNVECYPPGHVLAGYPTIRTVLTTPVPSDGELSLNDVYSSFEQRRNQVEGTTNKVVDLAFYAEGGISPGGLGGPNVFHDPSRVRRDERSANYWNFEQKTAMVQRDRWTTDTVVHELLHTFGAVAWDHPLSTGDSHCLVKFDLMCGNGGPRGYLFPVVSPPECPDTLPAGRRIDCLEAIYFRADHGDGTFLDWWLDERWNTIGAENRFVEAYPEWDYSVPCSKC